MADSFEFPIRVYYEDTDAGGVVFYANYLRFFERARTEWLRRCGVSQRRMTEQYQVMFVVKSTARPGSTTCCGFARASSVSVRWQSLFIKKHGLTHSPTTRPPNY